MKGGGDACVYFNENRLHLIRWMLLWAQKASLTSAFPEETLEPQQRNSLQRE